MLEHLFMVLSQESFYPERRVAGVGLCSLKSGLKLREEKMVKFDNWQ